MSYITPNFHGSYQNNAPQPIPKTNRFKKVFKNEVNPSYRFIQTSGPLNLPNQNQKAKMLINQKISVISCMKANLLTNSENVNPYTNSFDDGKGVFFSYYMTYLFKCVNEMIEELEKENITLAFKCEQFSYFLKTEIQKGFKQNSPTFFLAAFQTCIYLPKKYKNPVWKLLSKDFKDISFETVSPLIHAVHKLTFSERKPFDCILSFLNMLSIIYHGDNLLASSDEKKGDLVCPIEMSFTTTSCIASLDSHFISAIHLKTTEGALTLETPLDLLSGLNDFEKETDILNFIDLMKPLLIKHILIPELEISLDDLIKKNHFKEQRIKDFAKNLMLQEKPEMINFGFRMLLCCIKKNELDLKDFHNRSFQIKRKNEAIVACTELIIQKAMNIPITVYANKKTLTNVHKAFLIYFNMLVITEKEPRREYLEYYSQIMEYDSNLKNMHMLLYNDEI